MAAQREAVALFHLDLHPSLLHRGLRSRNILSANSLSPSHSRLSLCDVILIALLFLSFGVFEQNRIFCVVYSLHAAGKVMLFIPARNIRFFFFFLILVASRCGRQLQLWHLEVILSECQQLQHRRVRKF
jgi:hypothetical protein